MLQHLTHDVTAVWSRRRQRSQELRERYDFAAEVLAFYGGLLDVQERAYLAALEDTPAPQRVAAFAVERALPHVVEISVAQGPQAMTARVLESFDRADLEDVITRWLRGEDLPAVERYLARASAGPILEALGDAAGAACQGPRDERHCPTCGGAPQVSFFAASPEDLVTPHRYLECSRCAKRWAYARMTCAACGEAEARQLSVFSEIGTLQAELSGKLIKPGTAGGGASASGAHFPHLRIDGCTSCSRYVLNVDLERDAKAVPIVDELAALPLDLYAKERGLTKIVPNLMGF